MATMTKDTLLALKNYDQHLVTFMGRPSADYELSNAISTAANWFENQLSCYESMLTAPDKKTVTIMLKTDILDSDDFQRDPFETVLQYVSDLYQAAWPGMAHVDLEQTRHYHNHHPESFLCGQDRNQRNRIRQTTSRWDSRLWQEYHRLFLGVTNLPNLGTNDTDYLTRLHRAIGQMLDKPDPFAPYLTCIKPMQFIFGTLIGDQAFEITSHTADYAVIEIIPALGE